MVATQFNIVGDKQQLAWIRQQLKPVYIEQMMGLDGGFSAETSPSNSIYRILIIFTLLIAVTINVGVQNRTNK